MRGRVEVSFRLSDKAMDEGEWRSKWGLVPSGVVNGGGSGRGERGGGTMVLLKQFLRGVNGRRNYPWWYLFERPKQTSERLTGVIERDPTSGDPYRLSCTDLGLDSEGKGWAGLVEVAVHDRLG